MEAFIYGITGVLTFEITLFVVLSFVLFGRLSSFLGSHLAKVLILSFVSIFVTYIFTGLLSPSTVYELLSSFAFIVLIFTIAICLNFLGVFKAIKSAQLQSIIVGVLNWTAPVAFGCWLFLQSFTRLGPLMASLMLDREYVVDSNVYLIPLFFALGLVSVVGGVLLFSWFFHHKFKEMQFWKVTQMLASVAVLIISLRLLIMMTFV